MPRSKANFFLAIIVLLVSNYVMADIEYFSISENAVIMYDAPSLKADKLYVASLYFPVEVIVSVEGWAKVRDSSGSHAWIERKALSQQRFVVVTVPLADVYQLPDMNSALLFQAEESVVMEWLDSDNRGWVKIRHSDGQTGYVKTSQVWGS